MSPLPLTPFSQPLFIVLPNSLCKTFKMGKKGKVGKNRQDKFYHLAKEQGFRSRASFKLVQLNKRHDFLSSASRGILDLCAAPGGWLQVARKHAPLHAPVIGIDLVPIRNIPGCTSLTGDITAAETHTALRRALTATGGDGKVDAVLNDGSPNMGRAWLHDSYTQAELTLAALRLAAAFLAPGGTFVTKVFRSNDYNSLLFVMHQLFDRVHATKPAASRAESAEIYVLCRDFRAPRSIDPRLLNPKFVFKDLGAAPEASANDRPDLFLNTVMKDMKKQKRHRGGYEDGATTLFLRKSALSFCQASRPVAMLVETSQLSFEPTVMVADGLDGDVSNRTARLLASLPETTAEVLSCCEDLKVLARREFKLLLKWRVAARQRLSADGLLHTSTTDGEEAAQEDGEGEGDVMDNSDSRKESSDEDKEEKEKESEDDDDLLDREMLDVRAEQLAKEKRKKRKANKVRSAVQRKIDMKIILPDDGEAHGDAPHGLFSITSAQRVTGQNLANVTVDEAHDADDEAEDEENKDSEVRLAYRVGDINRDEPGDAEEDLDRWYKVYLSRKKRDKNGVLLRESKERRRVTKRRALREAFENGATEGVDVGEEGERTLVVDSSDSSEAEAGEEFHEPSSGNAKAAALWFSQPLFRGVAGLSSDESDGKDDVRMESGAENEEKMDEGTKEGFHGAARHEARLAAKREEVRREEDDDFDVVRKESLEDGANSDSSFHSSDYDSDEKAEMVAIGRRMRQSKREAADVLDEGYHRYTFDDPNDLPRWFADTDHVYRERQAPVTKEQVAEMKAYVKALQAAPTKKEAEAKARRRQRVAKRVEAMKAKGNAIAEQEDVPASSRMKAIEDLYKQAVKGKKSGKKGRPKQYQVVKPNGRISVGKKIGKGRKAGKGGRTTLVDKRLKSDKRGLAAAAKRNGKGKGKKGR